MLSVKIIFIKICKKIYKYAKVFDEKIIYYFFPLVLYFKTPLKRFGTNIVEVGLIQLKTLFTSHFNQFFEFINDFLIIYKKHKYFIGFTIRTYIYSILFLYIFVFFICTVALVSENFYALHFMSYCLQFYYFGTFPIKKFNFLIKYFFFIPLKIIEIILDSIFHTLKKSSTNKKTEAGSGKDEDYGDLGKSPAIGRQSSLSSSQGELNCMRNNALKTQFVFQTPNSGKNAAHLAAFAMDNDDKPHKIFSDMYKKQVEIVKNINDNNGCPTSYERELGNKKFE